MKNSARFCMRENSLWSRLRSHGKIKLALAIGLNLWAFVPYFWLQRHVFFPVALIQPTWVDRWIPFNPGAVWIYLSLFLLMPIAPLQMTRRNQLWRYALGTAGMSLAADVMFFFWPTTVPRPASQDANDLYRLLVTFVLPNNAAPSLHAAMALFSALCFEQIAAHVCRAQVWRVGLWVWAAAVLYATLATKEHLAVDIAAGCLLGVISYFCAFAQSSMKKTGAQSFARKKEQTLSPV